MAADKPDRIDLEQDEEQRRANEEMIKTHQAKNTNLFEPVHRTLVYDGVEYDEQGHYQPTSAGFRTCFYDELKPETTVEDGIQCERDVCMEMADGRRVYMDVYRPVDQLDEPLPVIFTWVPYGKRHWHGRGKAPALHQTIDVPKGTISDRAAFESPDPGYWCRNGYCCVNVDACGLGNSEGDNYFFYAEEGGRDGAEVIDWVGERPWCNGNVGMCGNSAMAISQWFLAAAKPKHLKAIAPWEGTNDLYYEVMGLGGMPFRQFAEMIWWDFRGPGFQPDMSYMMEKYPLWNSYWENHRAKIENIKIPAYICAGWQHQFHLRGTINGFRRIKSRNKWLRIHQEFEWADFNRPENRAELMMFFDRYLKNINNGWEMTPKVRVEVMDAGDHDCAYCTNRPELDFPIPRTKYTRLYLDASDMSMKLENPVQEASVTYDCLEDVVNFDFEVTEEMELTGFFKLHTWISSETDDADVFVYVKKVDENGEFVPTMVMGCEDPGAKGQLRASMRALDEEKSCEWQPIFKYDHREPLEPGVPVPLDIEIWPYGRIWHAGEKVRVTISGVPRYPKVWFHPVNVDSDNRGNHTVHTGGKYESYLLVPVIPPKVKAGKYEKRF